MSVRSTPLSNISTIHKRPCPARVKELRKRDTKTRHKLEEKQSEEEKQDLAQIFLVGTAVKSGATPSGGPYQGKLCWFLLSR